MQKHAARRLHYDLRLELGGVLVSWAVPRGPSLDPQDRRLAVHVENHPLDYAEFEGVIPEGNYGAGAVILWDRGQWIPVDDPEAGLEAGKLLFDLRGYKLRGRFTLVRTGKRGETSNEWLLIKKPDGFAGAERALAEESVLSGLTVNEMREGPARAAKLRERVAELGAPRRAVDVKDVALALCETRDAPFTDEDWIFELKYDGYRLLAAADGGTPRLRYRRGLEPTSLFPEIARAVAALPYESILLDGEVVVFDDAGAPDFRRLQARAQMRRPRDIERASVESPAALAVFDLVALEGHDLRPLPLLDRKRVLREALPAAGPLRYADHIAREGEAMYRKVEEIGLEGIIAKRASSTYPAGRSASWLKIPLERTSEFAVAGYSPAKGARTGFASLHLAVRGGDRWVYAGRVGSGLSEADLGVLAARMEALRRRSLAPDGAPSSRRHVWFEPAFAVEVRYKEWREDGLLRHPRFVAVRDDVRPEDCVGPRPSGDATPPEPEVAEAPVSRELELTNTGKPFWPDNGYTKGDLIDYYREIGEWLLPYLRDRPVVLTRYPDGIHGKSFFQKDAPEWVPEWIRTETMWSEHAGREIAYFVCDDVDSLAFVANMGTIPLHIWSSRVATLSRPDWCILDLDPKEAPFAHVVTCARAIKRLLDDIDLDAFIKTSGATGLHILVPLGGQCTYDQSRILGELIARVIEAELPDIATTVRQVRRRGGRVYLDYGQNGHGRLLVAPLSARPRPGAPVSMPLRWREVTPKLDPGRFTIANAARRLRRMGGDPLVPVLHTRPDLPAALARLGERTRANRPS